VKEQDRALARGPFPSRSLVRAISDGLQLSSQNATVRALALARVRASGARLVRIPVDWDSVLVHGTAVTFDATDPSSPAYSFWVTDAAVRDAVAQGLEPVLVVFDAPGFAQAGGRWPFAFSGTWAPEPQALGAFATAIARRYGGTFPDPGNPGGTLPHVRYFQAWNEPNLPRYLEPQWVAEGGRWLAFAPQQYRAMLNAFYVGVKAVRPDDVVIAAGLAPLGEAADGMGRTAPMRFMHSFLCLRPPPSLRSVACPDPPHFDVFAFHPLSAGQPDQPASSSLDVSIADIAKLTTTLRAAARAGRVSPAGPKPLWITELNWQSRPPSPEGVPARLQAHWIARALHRLWVAGAAVATWQFIADRRVPLPGQLGGAQEVDRPAGLYREGPGGRQKPFLRGFRFPFDPLRTARARVRIWALLPPGAGDRAVLERRGRRGWHAVARLRARGGMINAVVSLRGRAALRLRAAGQRSAESRLGAINALGGPVDCQPNGGRGFSRCTD
jgi:hypothetical protein